MTVRARTIATLRDRLRHAVAAFGEVPLRDLERMTNEIAGWQAQLPPRAGHGITQALRQALDAAVRWEYMRRNPAKLAGRNPKPPPRAVRAFTFAELDAIAEELSPNYALLPAFAGARPKFPRGNFGLGTTPRGVAGGRTLGRRPLRGDPHGPPHRLVGEGRRVGEDQR